MGNPRTHQYTGAQTEAAIAALREHTLAQFEPVAQLVYLASTRDYNSGKYHHDGLAWRFSEAAAQEALATSHLTVFRDLSARSLGDLTRLLAEYLSKCDEDQATILWSWRSIQVYSILVPAAADPLDAGLFISNMRMAAEIRAGGTAVSPLRGQPGQ